MKTLTIQTKDGSYPVAIGSDILGQLPPYAEKAGRVAVITDENVCRLHYEALKAYLPGHALFVAPSGERAKSMETYADIQTFLIQEGMGRDGLILAFGGGCIGDVAGFAAATFMRGIPYIQLPTTLLAQDSAVGGKVAINHDLGKNLIGAFYPPQAVLYELNFLETLDAKQWRSGLGEMIKHGFIASEAFLTALLESKNLNPLIFESVQIKQAVVEQDEFESGVRAHLNFGHTLGHALEKAHPELAHGEAIVIGMEFALWLSGLSLGMIQTFKKRFDYPNPMNKEQIGAYLAYMKTDKKNVAQQVRFVLLEAIGKPYLKAFSLDELRQKLEQFMEVA